MRIRCMAKSPSKPDPKRERKCNDKSVVPPNKKGEGADPVKEVIRAVRHRAKRKASIKPIDAKNIERDLQVAEMSIRGMGTTEIATTTGMCPATVKRILEKDEIEAAISLVYRKMVSRTLEPAFEQVDRLVQNYETTEDKAEKEHGFKAIQRTLESSGVFTGNQAPVHTQIINAQVNIMSPVVETLIDRYMLGPLSEENNIIDVETGEKEK